MAENFSTFPGQESQGAFAQNNCGQSNFKEAVCVDAYRVYDSCADKDCLEDTRVYFTESGQNIIEQACNVRIKDAKVMNVCINLEPIQFQKGYYAIDMTFFLEVSFDVCTSPASVPVSVCGLSVFNKRVILYGSEGSVKVYSSDSTVDGETSTNISGGNLPRAIVQVADPIALSSTLCEVNSCSCDSGCRIPECICQRYGGSFVCNGVTKIVRATIGLFTIVQIERSVQMLVPAYDFCMPEKECVTSSDNPCELFSRIDFPTDEFFPPRSAETQNSDNTGFGCGCCCKNKND